jgi:hypothetical protein
MEFLLQAGHRCSLDNFHPHTWTCASVTWPCVSIVLRHWFLHFFFLYFLSYHHAFSTEPFLYLEKSEISRAQFGHLKCCHCGRVCLVLLLSHSCQHNFSFYFIIFKLVFQTESCAFAQSWPWTVILLSQPPSSWHYSYIMPGPLWVF